MFSSVYFYIQDLLVPNLVQNFRQYSNFLRERALFVLIQNTLLFVIATTLSYRFFMFIRMH